MTTASRAAIAALVLLAFLPSLDSGFVWDDHLQVERSETVGHLESIPGYFGQSVIAGLSGGDSTADGINLYRPLFSTVLTLTYVAAGGPEPRAFHAVSLFWHILACLLLLQLAYLWLGRCWQAELAVLLFAFHPVATAGVLFISAVSEPIAAALLFAAVLVLDRGCAPGRPEAARHRASWLAAGVLFAALLGKETVVLALPVVTVSLVLAGRSRLVHHLPLWLAASVFLVLRFLVLGGLEAAGNPDGSLLRALQLSPVLVVEGLRALITHQPSGLRHLGLEYSSLGWSGFLGASAVLVAVVALATVVRRRVPLILPAVVLTALMVAPVALPASFIGWGGFGRYLYMPAALAALAAAQGAGLLVTHVQRSQRSPLVLVVPLALLVGVQQAWLQVAIHDWSSPEALASSQVRNAPHLGVGYGWLGEIDLAAAETRVAEGETMAARQFFERAVEHFEKAVLIHPDYHPAFQNLALAQLGAGRAEAALATMTSLEELHGKGPKSSLATAMSLAALGRFEEAAARTRWALERAPGDADLLWFAEQLKRHASEVRSDNPAPLPVSDESDESSGTPSSSAAPAPRNIGSP